MVFLLFLYSDTSDLSFNGFFTLKRVPMTWDEEDLRADVISYNASISACRVAATRWRNDGEMMVKWWWWEGELGVKLPYFNDMLMNNSKSVYS